jgi:glyoxylase-like metal-dependent hydrolase (beta-lactamase superfamily II)
MPSHEKPVKNTTSVLLFALVAALNFTLPSVAQAAAPKAQGQSPGWYRMALGDFEITALSDGTVALPVDKLLTNAAPGQVFRALSKNYLRAPVETSVNGYLVNTGNKLILVDTGAAGLFGPTLGKLLSNLKASGYQPEQVDEIYLTHLHPDHVGGLMAGDKRVFPNATIRADFREAEFWLAQTNMDRAPADAKDFFQGAMASMNPYIAAGKFKPFSGETDLEPGIRAIPTPGHTPGHAIYSFESDGDRFVVWGDLMHVAAVQFAEPAVTIQFDTDPKAAAPQRAKAFADSAKRGYYVALAHVAFPGIGKLRADGTGYIWIPAVYTNNAAAK